MANLSRKSVFFTSTSFAELSFFWVIDSFYERNFVSSEFEALATTNVTKSKKWLLINAPLQLIEVILYEVFVWYFSISSTKQN